jgi:hypothetical protein
MEPTTSWRLREAFKFFLLGNLMAGCRNNDEQKCRVKALE